MSMAFADRVQVARRFTRAVRVDADLYDVGALDGYICSQSAIETLLLMARHRDRSEEHTSELQSLMRISYAVFCLKKKKIRRIPQTTPHNKRIQHTKQTQKQR